MKIDNIVPNKISLLSHSSPKNLTSLSSRLILTLLPLLYLLSHQLHLDIYLGVKPGSWILLMGGEIPVFFKIVLFTPRWVRNAHTILLRGAKLYEEKIFFNRYTIAKMYSSSRTRTMAKKRTADLRIVGYQHEYKRHFGKSDDRKPLTKSHLYFEYNEIIWRKDENKKY